MPLATRRMVQFSGDGSFVMSRLPCEDFKLFGTTGRKADARWLDVKLGAGAAAQMDLHFDSEPELRPQRPPPVAPPGKPRPPLIPGGRQP